MEIKNPVVTMDNAKIGLYLIMQKFKNRFYIISMICNLFYYFFNFENYSFIF